MRKIIILSIITLSALVLAGCRTAKTATSCGELVESKIVTQLSHDTIYLSNIQYDSIFIQNDHSQEYHRAFQDSNDLKLETRNLKPDTIFVKDVAIQYKYKFLHDTCYVHQVDTIPVIQQVEVFKTEKYIPWYSKVLSWIGVICVLLIALWVVIKYVFKP